MTTANSGLLLGKFMPPHEGHAFAIRFARAMCDELTVVVDHLDGETIDVELRRSWLAQSFPDVRVVALARKTPQRPEHHPAFWQVWRGLLVEALGGAPALVFASEAYGSRLALELGARWVPVDPARAAAPVRATDVRLDPFAHWDAILPAARGAFLQRVSVFGPESTGKTTLARALAERFSTRWVPEYARTWIEAGDGECRIDDLPWIARGQAASEDALAPSARKLLLCDTDPLATPLWSEELFGRCHDDTRAPALGRRYALTLLCAPDVPWVDDPVRYRPEGGARFFARCEQALAEAGRPFVVISGDFDVRMQTAVRAIERHVEELGWTL